MIIRYFGDIYSISTIRRYLYNIYNTNKFRSGRWGEEGDVGQRAESLISISCDPDPDPDFNSNVNIVVILI